MNNLEKAKAALIKLEQKTKIAPKRLNASQQKRQGVASKSKKKVLKGYQLSLKQEKSIEKKIAALKTEAKKYVTETKAHIEEVYPHGMIHCYKTEILQISGSRDMDKEELNSLRRRRLTSFSEVELKLTLPVIIAGYNFEIEEFQKEIQKNRKSSRK